MDISVQLPCWGVNLGAGFAFFTVRQKDFIANGIKWFERWQNIAKIPVSHCGVITGSNSTIEAFARGVDAGTLDYYLNDENVALLIRRPLHWSPGMGAVIVAEAQKHLGDKYNYALIAAMAFDNTIFGHFVNKWTKGWLERTVEGWADNADREICSSVVAKSLNAPVENQGVGILSDPAYTIMPVELFSDEQIFELGAIELVPHIP